MIWACLYIRISDVEHFQQVEARSSMVALRLQCMNRGKSRRTAERLVKHLLRNIFDTWLPIPREDSGPRVSGSIFIAVPCDRIGPGRCT